MNSLIPLVALSSLIVPSLASAGDHPAPRWNFKKGQVLPYLLKHREVRAVKIGDQKLEAVNQSEYEWKWTVTAVDDQGIATLEQKFTALRLNSTAKNFDFSYDSSRPNRSDDDYQKS